MTIAFHDENRQKQFGGTFDWELAADLSGAAFVKITAGYGHIE
jgi:hypothetical protein